MAAMLLRLRLGESRTLVLSLSKHSREYQTLRRRYSTGTPSFSANAAPIDGAKPCRAAHTRLTQFDCCAQNTYEPWNEIQDRMSLRSRRLQTVLTSEALAPLARRWRTCHLPKARFASTELDSFSVSIVSNQTRLVISTATVQEPPATMPDGLCCWQQTETERAACSEQHGVFLLVPSPSN